MLEELKVLPLTSDRWGDFETLFGPSGACYGCWCTHFRIPTSERKTMDGDAKKAFMQARVVAGPSPGILGYIGERPVAWAQVGPRSELPKWNSPKTVSRPLDPADAEDDSVWAVSCFFMNSRDRGKGYSHRMLSEAVNFAKASGARILEGCPIERTKQSKSVGLYVGSLRIFEAAGFSEVAKRKDGRPLMRLVL
ncbi:GNAT family N-acetyltransferase [Agrobacterium rhizogenes]|uniref:GNAT family N-acetyltransferase n=1 Tax=Rhizobium rhizogenes TaxID=359 RepID=UPI00157406F2|nr:GNAT family N-acetyltransferase [Rhizobium rhizogenes]NTG48863.1 GNAT family N-acetyltransferase [Rhizobium rhizogenes]